MTKDNKKAVLKKMVKGCKDGMGGASYGSSDSASIAPYKNSFYKRMKAMQAFQRVAKTTGLGN